MVFEEFIEIMVLLFFFGASGSFGMLFGAAIFEGLINQLRKKR